MKKIRYYILPRKTRLIKYNTKKRVFKKHLAQIQFEIAKKKPS